MAKPTRQLLPGDTARLILPRLVAVMPGGDTRGGPRAVVQAVALQQLHHLALLAGDESVELPFNRAHGSRYSTSWAEEFPFYEPATVQRALADLAAAGLIEITPGIGRTRRYRIDRGAVTRASGQPAAELPAACPEASRQAAPRPYRGEEKQQRGGAREDSGAPLQTSEGHNVHALDDWRQGTAKSYSEVER